MSGNCTGTFHIDDGIVNIAPPGGEAGKHLVHYLQIITMYNKKKVRETIDFHYKTHWKKHRQHCLQILTMYNKKQGRQVFP